MTSLASKDRFFCFVLFRQALPGAKIKHENRLKAATNKHLTWQKPYRSEICGKDRGGRVKTRKV